MSNATNLSYWFNQKVMDNNGNMVSDINAGLRKLLPDLMPILNNLQNNHEEFMIDDTLLGQPDYMAASFNGGENLFWYICLANLVADPFGGFDTEHVYYAFDNNYLTQLCSNKNSGAGTQSAQKEKIGKIVTLN